MEGNVAAGSERVGFHTSGETCDLETEGWKGMGVRGKKHIIYNSRLKC